MSVLAGLRHVVKKKPNTMFVLQYAIVSFPSYLTVYVKETFELENVVQKVLRI